MNRTPRDGPVSRGSPPLKLAVAMWSIAAVFYLLGFFFRVTPGVLNQELMRDFGLSAAMLGNLASFYYYFYAVLQIPTGVSNDRFGPKALIVTGAALCGLGGIVFAVADDFAAAAAGRALMGFGHGMAWVSMLTLASAWFAPRRFGTVSGISLAVGTLGAVLAQAPLRIAADTLGWRSVIGTAGLLGLVVAVLALVFVKATPTARGYESYAPPRQTPSASDVIRGLIEVWRYRDTVLLFLVPGGLCGALLTFTTLWGTPFLAQHHGMSTKEASYLIAAMLVLFSLGSVFFGRLSDAWQRRKSPYLLGAMPMILGFGALAVQPDLPFAVLAALLLAAAFGSGAMVLGFAFAKESVPIRLAGTATGVHNMGVMIGTLTQLPLLGWVLDHYWQGVTILGVRQYDLFAFKAAFGVLFAWILASAVMLMLTRETHARQRQQEGLGVVSQP